MQGKEKDYPEITHMMICFVSSVDFSLCTDCDQLTCGTSTIFTALCGFCHGPHASLLCRGGVHYRLPPLAHAPVLTVTPAVDPSGLKHYL